MGRFAVWYETASCQMEAHMRKCALARTVFNSVVWRANRPVSCLVRVRAGTLVGAPQLARVTGEGVHDRAIDCMQFELARPGYEVALQNLAPLDLCHWLWAIDPTSENLSDVLPPFGVFWRDTFVPFAWTGSKSALALSNDLGHRVACADHRDGPAGSAQLFARKGLRDLKLLLEPSASGWPL